MAFSLPGAGAIAGTGPFTALNFFVALYPKNFDQGLGAISSGLSVASAMTNFVIGGFSECTGLESTIEIEEFKEGGVNDRVHKFPTRSSFSNITLKRGIGFGEDLWLWHEQFVEGVGARRDGLIVLANELNIPIKIWSFENGIPIKWSGPSFNATSSATAIESLEIAHEKLGLLMSPGKALDLAADAITSAVGSAF